MNNQHERNPNYPQMYKDGFFPTYAINFLYGLEWDFMKMEVLIIASMDLISTYDKNITSGLALGVLIAYLMDCFMIKWRGFYGRKNLSVQTVTDEKFLIS